MAEGHCEGETVHGRAGGRQQAAAASFPFPFIPSMLQAFWVVTPTCRVDLPFIHTRNYVNQFSYHTLLLLVSCTLDPASSEKPHLWVHAALGDLYAKTITRWVLCFTFRIFQIVYDVNTLFFLSLVLHFQLVNNILMYFLYYILWLLINVNAGLPNSLAFPLFLLSGEPADARSSILVIILLAICIFLFLRIVNES